MGQQRTHLWIDARLCGTPLELAEGRARVEMDALTEMAADERGLVHGGFCFGLADYAAMLAVNDPLVVLGSAEVRFLRPVVVGEKLVAEAELKSSEGKKRSVEVRVLRGDEPVFEGRFLCLVPARHVLDKT